MHPPPQPYEMCCQVGITKRSICKWMSPFTKKIDQARECYPVHGRIRSSTEIVARVGAMSRWGRFSTESRAGENILSTPKPHSFPLGQVTHIKSVHWVSLLQQKPPSGDKGNSGKSWSQRLSQTRREMRALGSTYAQVLPLVKKA